MVDSAPRTCSVCTKGENEIGQTCKESNWKSHKGTCKRQNYLLRVQLAPGDIEDPIIFRTLSCPAKASFEEFHDALQIAFGWASAHLYDFKIGDKLRIVGESSFDDFGPPETESTKIQLYQVFDSSSYHGLPVEYEYDFGDGWSHDITPIGRTDATDIFLCTDGEGHECAEDVGGPGGWDELKEAYRARKPTKAQREHKNWYETCACNGDEGGLGHGSDRVWSKEEINRDLADMSGER
ncbi:hypothetical protein MMC07_007149 [Pseudocyphellaria aurata]|nr:hypothetical protein [Pseudocyphellaria aurata]